MTTLEFKEVEEADFDPGLIYPDTPFTQAGFYGHWQKSLGRKVFRFLAKRGQEPVAFFQLIKYPLAFGRSYFYLPYGPVTKDFSAEFLAGLRRQLLELAQRQQAVFLRLDFTPAAPAEILSRFFTPAKLYTYGGAHFQPRLEWVLALDKTLEEIYEAMDKKTRYSIRLAEKKGVTAEIVTAQFEKYFETFYQLMVETAERDSFSLHPKGYYQQIFQNLLQIKNSYLAVASYDSKILAIDLIIVYNRTAYYVFGGSSSQYRSLCPSYLAKWRSINQAQKLNCLNYNFGAIATDDKIDQGWKNLTTFKKRFGGRALAHSDFFDLVVSPFWYRLYNFRKWLKQK